MKSRKSYIIIFLIIYSFLSGCSAPVMECDNLAAHPDDPDKKANGVEFEKINANTAISACLASIKEHPKEARFIYQLARAEYAKNKNDDNFRNKLKKAAELNYTFAIYKVGKNYENAEKGFEKDISKARTYYQKSADAGYSEGYASLAYLELIGGNITENTLNLLEKAGDLGSGAGYFNLGYVYLYGHFNDKVDKKLGLKYLIKASELGFERAYDEIAGVYTSDVDLMDFIKAEQYVNEAIKKDLSVGFHRLGLLYEKNIIKDDDNNSKAIKNYTTGADKGYKLAYGQLLEMLYFRHGKNDKESDYLIISELTKKYHEKFPQLSNTYIANALTKNAETEKDGLENLRSLKDKSDIAKYFYYRTNIYGSTNSTEIKKEFYKRLGKELDDGSIDLNLQILFGEITIPGWPNMPEGWGDMNRDTKKAVANVASAGIRVTSLNRTKHHEYLYGQMSGILGYASLYGKGAKRDFNSAELMLKVSLDFGSPLGEKYYSEVQSQKYNYERKVKRCELAKDKARYMPEYKANIFLGINCRGVD